MLLKIETQQCSIGTSISEWNFMIKRVSNCCATVFVDGIGTWHKIYWLIDEM